jgi:hypothetical protein
LNDLHFRKMRTIASVAPDERGDFDPSRGPRQRVVHHATDRSPFNPSFTMPREWASRRVQFASILSAEYRCDACLSVRLSGV